MIEKGNMLVEVGVGTTTSFLDEAIYHELERAGLNKDGKKTTIKSLIQKWRVDICRRLR